MNWNAVKAIVRKDLKVVIQNKSIVIPLIAMPVVILIGFPALATLSPMIGDMFGTESFDKLIQYLPGIQQALSGYNGHQRFAIFLLVYFGAPFYLLMPTMVAITIACDSFAGEKERKTLEALLYTPTSDWELLVGKLLSAWLPALGVAWGGFLLYAVTANLGAWSLMGRVFFPPTMWVILAVWVAPAMAGLGLSAAILISSRARTFQEAYNLGSMVGVLAVLLLIAQVFGGMLVSVWVVVLLGLLIWALDAALLWFGRRGFQRSKLATQM